MAETTPPSGPGGRRRLPEDIFNDALALPAAQRDAFLAHACGADDDLRAQLLAMIALAADDPCLALPLAGEAPSSRIGKYELLAERGRGGMGIVFAARDTQLDRVVALKLLPARLTRDEAARARFAREARLLATLKDERIATIYTFEEVDDVCFLTMEWVEGRTLAERLQEGPLPPREGLWICRQIAEALAVTHAHQIVHRDLKPSNVMITPAGGVKILDFGVAKALDDAARPDGAAPAAAGALTTTRGTPGYMAPEQFLGGGVDHRCDLWALGCVLFECLTGERAITAVAADRRDALAGLPATVPAPVRELLRRCLTVDPRAREISAATAATALARALAATAGRRRRRRWGVPMAAGALVLVVAIIAFATWRSSPAPLASIAVSDARVLRAQDPAGGTLWVRTLPAPLVPHLLETGAWTFDPPKILHEGADAVGVIVATDGFAAGEGGGVWCLAPRDGHPLWRWDVAWQRPVNAQGSLQVLCTATLPWPGRAAPAIAVVLWDRPWYGSAVTFLDAEGTDLGTYYHPGALEYAAPLTQDDGTQVIVLAGLNSSARFVPGLNPGGGRAHCGCLVLLRPPAVSGQGFPYSEGLPEPRDWPGMPRAPELAYVAIPLVHPSFDARVNSLTVNDDPEGAARITVRTADGRFFFFDDELNPVSCYVRTRSVADSLQARGEAAFLPLMRIAGGQTTWPAVTVSF